MMESHHDSKEDRVQSGALGTMDQSGSSRQSGPTKQPGNSNHSSAPGQPSDNGGLGAQAYATLRDEEIRRLLGGL